MIRHVCSIIACAAAVAFCAQGSGMYFETHLSRGTMDGDNLYHLEGQKIGAVYGDSIRYLENGAEAVQANNYTSLYPVEFQYVVRYSFLAGYEKSFNKALSVRGAVGYQKVLMDAHASTIPNFAIGDMTEVPYVSAEITRHWISIPVDFKATIPIGRGGVYLAAGPKMSILLSSEYSDSLTNATKDLTNLTSSVNFGLGFRLGAEFSVANAGFIFIESGYTLGLLNTSPISTAKTKEGEIALLGIGFRVNFPR